MATIVRRTAATLRHRFSVDTDGPVTVDAYDVDGETVLAAAEATQATGGWWTVTLAVDDCEDLDLLEVQWWSPTAIETDHVAVVGASYVTPADFRDLRMPTDASDLLLADVVDEVIDRTERYCRQSFVPRLTDDVVAGDGNPWLWLHPRARTVRRAEIDGRPVDTTGWQVSPTGRVHTGLAVPAGARVQVLYEHGMDQPPGDLRAALAAAARQLVSERMQGAGQQRREFAEGASWLIATADPARDRPFGMPLVDSVLRLHRWQEVVL